MSVLRPKQLQSELLSHMEHLFGVVSETKRTFLPLADGNCHMRVRIPWFVSKQLLPPLKYVIPFGPPAKLHINRSHPHFDFVGFDLVSTENRPKEDPPKTARLQDGELRDEEGGLLEEVPYLAVRPG